MVEVVYMKTRFRNEGDQWTTDGSQITAPETLAAIRKILVETGPILVQHWFYRGASSPRYTVFDDFEVFMLYLNQESYAGDAIDIWNISEICTSHNQLATGKCPDENGMVPKGGAY